MRGFHLKIIKMMERKFLKLLLRNINLHSFIKQWMAEWKTSWSVGKNSNIENNDFYIHILWISWQTISRSLNGLLTHYYYYYYYYYKKFSFLLCCIIVIYKFNLLNNLIKFLESFDYFITDIMLCHYTFASSFRSMNKVLSRL